MKLDPRDLERKDFYNMLMAALNPRPADCLGVDGG